jgi:hypothetical protein
MQQHIAKCQSKSVSELLNRDALLLIKYLDGQTSLGTETNTVGDSSYHNNVHMRLFVVS